MHSMSGSSPGLLGSARRARWDRPSHRRHYMARPGPNSTADCQRFSALRLWHRPGHLAMAGFNDSAFNDLGQHPADIHGELPAPLLSSATVMGQPRHKGNISSDLIEVLCDLRKRQRYLVRHPCNKTYGFPIRYFSVCFDSLFIAAGRSVPFPESQIILENSTGHTAPQSPQRLISSSTIV